MGCGVATQQLCQAVAVDLRVRALAVRPELLRGVQLGLLTDPGAAFPLTRYALHWRLACSTRRAHANMFVANMI